jgi:hypothetical protein
MAMSTLASTRSTHPPVLTVCLGVPFNGGPAPGVERAPAALRDAGLLKALAARSVARALVDYVHESLATEVILGHRRRNRWMPGDTTSEVIRRLSGVDVHILRVESLAS